MYSTNLYRCNLVLHEAWTLRVLLWQFKIAQPRFNFNCLSHATQGKPGSHLPAGALHGYMQCCQMNKVHKKKSCSRVVKWQTLSEMEPSRWWVQNINDKQGWRERWIMTILTLRKLSPCVWMSFKIADISLHPIPHSAGHCEMRCCQCCCWLSSPCGKDWASPWVVSSFRRAYCQAVSSHLLYIGIRLFCILAVTSLTPQLHFQVPEIEKTVVLVCQGMS